MRVLFISLLLIISCDHTPVNNTIETEELQMAFEQIPPYADSDTNPEYLMDNVDILKIGKINLTLTEYKTSVVPEIAAGSIIEVNGALFKAGTDIPITVGLVTDGEVYIIVTSSGVSPDQILSASLTNTPPDDSLWSDTKQGWYDISGVSRYIEYGMYKETTTYNPKWQIPFDKGDDSRVYSDGVIVDSVDTIVQAYTSHTKNDSILASGQLVIIPFETIDTDTQGEMSYVGGGTDGSFFTPDKSGYYRVNLDINGSKISDNTLKLVYQISNVVGAPSPLTKDMFIQFGSGTATNWSQDASSLIYLAKGKVVIFAVEVTLGAVPPPNAFSITDSRLMISRAD